MSYPLVEPLQSLVYDDDVTITGGTVKDLLSAIETGAHFKHVRISNNTGADVYLKIQKASTTASASTASATIRSTSAISDGGSATFDISEAFHIHCLGSNSGDLRVEVFG